MAGPLFVMPTSVDWMTVVVAVDELFALDGSLTADETLAVFETFAPV